MRSEHLIEPDINKFSEDWATLSNYLLLPKAYQKWFPNASTYQCFSRSVYISPLCGSLPVRSPPTAPRILSPCQHKTETYTRQCVRDNISGTIYPGQYIRDKIRDQWDKSKQGTCYLVRHCINKNNCKQGMVWLDVIGLYTTLYHNDIQPFYQLERSWQDSLIIWSVSSFRKQNQFPLRPELKPLLFLPPLLIDFYLTSLSN